MKNVKFEDAVLDSEYQTVTYYFIVDKNILKEFNIEEPENTIHAEISVEVPLSNFKPSYATIELSPTVEYEDGSTEDIAWVKISLPNDEIVELLSIGREEFRL